MTSKFARLWHRHDGRPRLRAVLLAAFVIALVMAPFGVAATGDALRAGKRNTSGSETKIVSTTPATSASTGGYATRQSNTSNSGGGAIYGCRSGEGGTPKGNKPCVRAANLAKGFAFEFDSRGTQGGTITVGNGGDTTKPFTTNATGVAVGLNADRVDGKNASDIVSDAQAQLPFAQVSNTGALGAKRGVASAAHDSAGVYTVVFDSDVSKCGYNATVIDDGTAPGTATVQPVDAKTLRVRTRQTDGTLADRGFHLTATC
jgi:hypothetical protein